MGLGEHEEGGGEGLQGEDLHRHPRVLRRQEHHGHQVTKSYDNCNELKFKSAGLGLGRRASP